MFILYSVSLIESKSLVLLQLNFDLDEFNQTGHYMMLVSVSGSVRYKGHGIKLFYENFMLKTFDTKWKIVSDCYRFAE